MRHFTRVLPGLIAAAMMGSAHPGMTSERGPAVQGFSEDPDTSGTVAPGARNGHRNSGVYRLELASNNAPPDADTSRGEPTSRTFTYKTTPQGKLEMVVQLPPGWKETDTRPGIVFFFGGGWNNGTIKQFEPHAEHLARLGMVAARADYRVKSRQGVTPESCVEDAKSAIRWFRANAARLGLDPHRIVASGGSAGGHIAACTALTEGLEASGEDPAISSRPDAMVLFNPVLRFEGIPQLMERISNDEALGKKISPTLHVTKTTPPTLIFFGTADKLLPQGEEFIQKAKEVGFRGEMFTAKDQPHSFFNRSPWRERTIARMDEFLTSLGYVSGSIGSSESN